MVVYFLYIHKTKLTIGIVTSPSSVVNMIPWEMVSVSIRSCFDNISDKFPAGTANINAVVCKSRLFCIKGLNSTTQPMGSRI